MFNSNNEEIPTTLDFEVNWIYSRTKLLSDSVNQTEREIRDKRQEL